MNTPPVVDTSTVPNYKVEVATVITVTKMATAKTTTMVTPDMDVVKDKAIRTSEGAVPEENIVELTVTAPISAGTLIQNQRVTKTHQFHKYAERLCEEL